MSPSHRATRGDDRPSPAPRCLVLSYSASIVASRLASISPRSLPMPVPSASPPPRTSRHRRNLSVDSAKGFLGQQRREAEQPAKERLDARGPFAVEVVVDPIGAANPSRLQAPGLLADHATLGRLVHRKGPA